MRVDMLLVRIHVARMVLSPTRKICGSYLCTLRAVSESVATGVLRAFLFLICMYLKNGHYSLFDRVHDSAPDGSGPRDCVVLFKKWRIISKSFAIYLTLM